MKTYTYNELLQIGTELNNHKRLTVEQIARSVLYFKLEEKAQIHNIIKNDNRTKAIQDKYSELMFTLHEEEKRKSLIELHKLYLCKFEELKDEQKNLDMFMNLCKVRSDFIENKNIAEEITEAMKNSNDNYIPQKLYTENEKIFHDVIKKTMGDIFLNDDTSIKILLDFYYLLNINEDDENLFFFKKHQQKELKESRYLVDYDCKNIEEFKKNYPFDSITKFVDKEIFSHIVDIVEEKIPSDKINERKLKFKKAILSSTPKTIIYDTSINEQNLNTALVQLDLSKSKKEIIEYIKKLKDDYDNNQLVINPLKLIDYNKNEEPYQRAEEHKDIYNLKKGSNKPLHKILSTILFIFDCKMIGLNTQTLINDAFQENISQKTINNYTNIGIDYIENKKFLNFILSC